MDAWVVDRPGPVRTGPLRRVELPEPERTERLHGLREPRRARVHLARLDARGETVSVTLPK